MTEINLQDIIKRLHQVRRDAIAQGICSQCHKKPEYYSEEGRREYRISGLCEFCFDLTCAELCIYCQKPESWHTHGRTDCRRFEAPQEDDDADIGDDV